MTRLFWIISPGESQAEREERLEFESLSSVEEQVNKALKDLKAACIDMIDSIWVVLSDDDKCEVIAKLCSFELLERAARKKKEAS